MKRFSPFLLCCLAVLFAQGAEAARAYSDGTIYQLQATCPVTGGAEVSSDTYAGFYTDPNEPWPRVGDIGYVHGVTGNVGCSNDTVGLEFFLPAGATLAISANTPVYCLRGKIGTQYIESVPNASNSGCSQTPTIGEHGGYFFGFSALPAATSTAPGWFLEIQVPVAYGQQLYGIGGPNSDRLIVVADTAFNTPSLYPVAYQPVTVYAAAPAQQTLTVLKSGSGTVTSNPAGISCGATCSASFTAGSSVTLTAIASAQFAFSGWSAGPCSGSSPSCTVTLNQSQSVTASFTSIVLPGSLNLGVTGLPMGVAANLTITGPSGFDDAISLYSGLGSQLSDVTAGSYTVSGAPVSVGTTTYSASPQSVTVPGGGVATVTLNYSAQNSPGTADSSVALGAQVDYFDESRADYPVWRPSNGDWYIFDGIGQSVTRQWGASTDIPLIGDYDGDGKSDIAVWRPSTGTWYIIQSSNGQILSHQWGASGDIPVPGDYDGDGKTDFAVWRPSTGTWYVILSSNGQVVSRQWGASGDVPVPGDYDGDGKTDFAVWRPSTGTWYVIQSSNGQVVSRQWGASGDVPVSGDYDGDGKTDFAVWRPSTGTWYVIQSSNGQIVSRQWGASGDTAVARDYDGDGKTDIAVWRPSTGTWYIIQSSNGQLISRQWGASGDVPVSRSVGQ